MKSEKALAAIVVLVITIALPGNAVEETAPSSGLSERLAALEFILGTWTVNEIFEPGAMGSGGKGTGEMVASVGPGGRSIVIDYRSLDGPMAGFSMHEILTSEGSEGMFQSAYVTNRSAGLTTARGKVSENGFVFERQIDRLDQSYVSRGTIQEISDGSFAMESHMDLVDGESIRVMRLQYSRP